MPTFDPATEPARGSYPHPALISLPGHERIAGPDSLLPPPPIRHLFGMKPRAREGDESVFVMPTHPWLQTHAGVFLASASALVADAPLGQAIIHDCPPGAYGSTSQLSMSFQRPVTPESRELIARARTIDVGSALGLSEATVTDASGRVVSLMTSRYVLTHFDDLPEPPEQWVKPQPTYDTPDPFERPLGPEVGLHPRPDLDGLSFQLGLIDGSIPRSPDMHLFGIRPTEASNGWAVGKTIASEWFCSPAHTVYGGVLAYLADSALTSAALTTIPAGGTVATLDLTLHYLRPVRPTGEELTMVGEVLHRGKRLIVATVTILNAAEKPVVMGNGSLRVLEGRTWSPDGAVRLDDD